MLFDLGQGGYKLHRFEFYNWGCFDGKIYQLAPGGESSLLTGANGSGKTTLVDALITLLVPSSKRHYNQSSGADRKRERTERSYVLGAIGSRRSEEQTSAVAEYLRDKKDYSVLLGVFKNEALQRELCLGQIRRFTSGGLSQLYFSSPMELSLKEHLLPLDFNSNFRKNWHLNHGINFYESFSLYARYFLPILGLRSEKALNLFSHIVGVKVLGNLNEFIRDNMLDTPDMENEFQGLHSNYQQLFNAHRKIELAGKQLEYLEPVIDCIEEFEKSHLKITEYRENKQLVPGFFASMICQRVDFELDLKTEELNLGQEKRQGLEKKHDDYDRERRDLQNAIDKNDAAQQILRIEDEIRHNEEIKTSKLNNFKRYNQVAQRLKIGELKKEADYLENKQWARQKEKEIDDKYHELEERLFLNRQKISRIVEEKENREADILSLMKRKNNIPRTNIEMRHAILEALGLTEKELPFAGELIQVKDSELQWELAAERILHNFALCLLVNEEHYLKVNRFVNKNNLKGRLIYYRTGQEAFWTHDRDIDAESLIYKLEIKKESPFFHWVENHLHNHFDYRCVEKVDDFSHFNKAVTPEGLVKSGERHEKDDRKADRGRENFVLGWDNYNKISMLREQVRQLSEDLSESQKTFEQLRGRQDEYHQIKADLTRFNEFRNFNELNWWESQERVLKLENDKKELAAASKELQQLQKKLENLEAEIKKLRNEIKDTDQYIGSLEEVMKNLLSEKESYSQLLEHFAGIVFDEQKICRLIGKTMEGLSSLSLEGLKNARLDSFEKIEVLLNEAEEKFHAVEKKLVKTMTKFKSPGGDILREYPGWEELTIELAADVEFKDEYKRIFEVLNHDDLPRYKKDFKEFLNEKMIEDLVNFRQSLEDAENEIKKSIDELNSALGEIEYNKSPSTYIILHYEPARDNAILTFKGQLKNILGNVLDLANRDEGALEKLFSNMQRFILQLQEDNYKRKKLLDVRNWLNFSAIERFREDDKEKQFYQDSQSLSGGEKAKLAYTILASAIAYQFNISGEGSHHRSFRFAIVDEAFSKVDPENSVYAMDLFKKLELQLMVVTPLDKINIVEDYIKAVHFVESDGQRSSLYNMTLEEYREKKKEFAIIEQNGQPTGS